VRAAKEKETSIKGNTNKDNSVNNNTFTGGMGEIFGRGQGKEPECPSPGCELLPITERQRKNAELWEQHMAEEEKETLLRNEAQHCDWSAIAAGSCFAKSKCWTPLNDYNGSRTMSPVTIRQRFMEITGGLYGKHETDKFCYWSANQYPASHNGSLLTLQHLSGAVPAALLDTLTHTAKLELVSLLEEERRVIRNICSQYYRDNGWRKAYALRAYDHKRRW
jgi:hypothetical protein